MFIDFFMKRSDMSDNNVMITVRRTFSKEVENCRDDIMSENIGPFGYITVADAGVGNCYN